MLKSRSRRACHAPPAPTAGRGARAGKQIMRMSQYIIVFFGFFMGVLVRPRARRPSRLGLGCLQQRSAPRTDQA